MYGSAHGRTIGERARSLWRFGALGAAIVLARSFVAVRYEGFYFDSDQAIVGLMAKHVAEFRHFPLFYYSLNYLLAVQAWLIAPFFWIARPTVAVMRMPLVALNLVVAVWLVVAIAREHRLRPSLAFVAALPFVSAGPIAANHLLEAAGSSIEPFVYILLLWHLRERPAVFGALAAVAFLHREFTLAAIPALVLAEIYQGTFWRPGRFRWSARAGAGFGFVWLIVDDLKSHLMGSSLALHAAALRGQVCLDAGLADRVKTLFASCLPVLFGGQPAALRGFRMDSPLIAGHEFVGALLAALVLFVLARLALTARDNIPRRSGFGLYLAVVGTLTAMAYPLSCNVLAGAAPLIRYAVLVVYLPVGVAALYFEREPSLVHRTPVIGVMVLWAVVNVIDNGRLIVDVARRPPLNEHRALADYLTAHAIRYGRATYLDAYVVDFLSRERVIVGSLDIVRIEEYEKRVDEHANAAVTLWRVPCAYDERVASWCVQRP